MQKWTRWQAWVALLAGAYGALSPIWTDTTTKATWTMVVLGAATAALALWALTMPADRIAEYGVVLMGALFIVAPWVMSFDTVDNLALTAWIVGGLTMVAGILGTPEVDRRMHHGPIAH